MQRFDEAQHLCKFEVTPAEEKIFQLQKNWFAVFSPSSFTVLQKCRNGSAYEIHLKTGLQKVFLSPGCEAQFLDHLVVSDFTVRLDSEIITYDWDWDPLSFLPTQQVEVLTENLEKLRQLGVDRPQLSQLQYATHTQSFKNYADIAATVVLILALLIVTAACIFCYCKCRSQRSTKDSTQATDRPVHVPEKPVTPGIIRRFGWGRNQQPSHRWSLPPVHYNALSGNVQFRQEEAQFLPPSVCGSQRSVHLTRHDSLDRNSRRSSFVNFSPRQCSTLDNRRSSIIPQAPYQPIHTQVIREQIYQDPKDFNQTMAQLENLTLPDEIQQLPENPAYATIK
jgi:hypothetical protein